MYASKAKSYIRKLINIQKAMRKQGLVRHDIAAVARSIDHLENYLNYFKYDTDEKMHRFYTQNIDRIRLLLPSQNHQDYQKLLQEFIDLKDYEYATE
jgi:hypothetical protein